MDIRVVAGDIASMPAGAVIVNLFEGVKSPAGATGAVDKALDGLISQLIADGEIKGKLGEMTLLHTMGKIASPRVLVAGLGKQAGFDLDKVRQVAAGACRRLRQLGVGNAATIVHGAGIGGMDPSEAAQALAEGSILGLYEFNRHKSKPSEEKDLTELRIAEFDAGKVPALEQGVARGCIMADATALARDLINEPSNYMTPTILAERALAVANERGLVAEVLDRERMQELGMGALLGVAQGSQQPPRLIVLRHNGDPASSGYKLGLVGKGITFDSGGISIKPAQGMDEMKTDMSGGAAVIAAMSAIAQLKPKINVLGVVPATENLPSGTALKPGDVLRAMNGKTIEVLNTDAEGRLILADALCYARSLGAQALVDAATLTGACRIALGEVCSGAMTNNQELLARVKAAADAAGEKVWELPMFEEYKEQIKSDVADMTNTGGQGGGAITAAKILAEFVEDTPWVHLDIAGKASTSKEKGYLTKGGTGVMVRTFANLAVAMAG